MGSVVQQASEEALLEKLKLQAEEGGAGNWEPEPGTSSVPKLGVGLFMVVVGTHFWVGKHFCFWFMVEMVVVGTHDFFSAFFSGFFVV